MTGPVLAEGVAAAVAALAAVPRLLVATDFDGVLAPLVDDPSTSAPLPGGAAALVALSALPRTSVALLSGRALTELARLSGLGPPIRLVGSHGVQWPDRQIAGFDDGRAAALVELTAAFEALAADHEQVWVEHKPVSAVLHTRRADADVAAAATSAAQAWLAGRDDLHVTVGKRVVDVAVVATGKGTALDTLRALAEADSVVYFGDDVTDEHAFLRLGPEDVGVKVGPGPTAALLRVDGPPDVVAVLHALAQARAAD